MADVHRHIRRPGRTIEYPIDADVAIAVGDLMFWDKASGYAEPISAFTWDASEEVTRRNATSTFAGVSKEARTGRETHDSSMILDSGCVFTMPMTSGTPVIGTLLGFKKASGNTLEPQKLTIVTDIADAIGYCIKRYTVATTTVECILFSPYDVEGGLQSRVKYLPLYVQATLYAAGGNWMLNWTFKHRVKLLAISSVEVEALTGDAVVTLVNGTDDLDDTHTITATAVGTVLRTTIEDANAFDIFEHDDPLDITASNAASAGSAQLMIEYMDMPLI